MPQCNQSNPLDRVFLALDAAWARLGLPGVDIHLHLELRGQVDVDGLRDALSATGRIYPAINAKLVRAGWLREPIWTLRPADAQGASVQVVAVENDSAVSAWSEAAVASRLDWARHAPLQVSVLRSRTGDDHVVARWPHALMDARGGATVVEEIAAQYRAMQCMSEPERIDYCRSLRSKDDDRRDDFGAIATVPASGRTRGVPAQSPRRAAVGTTLRLCPPAMDPAAETMRIVLRRFSPAETQTIHRNGLRICGLARHADFVRACAVKAFAELLPHDAPADGVITSLHMIDNRKRRDPGPVCHNVFSTLPVWIPRAQAGDRPAVADCFRDAALRAIENEEMPRSLAQLKRLAKVPVPLLSRILAAALRSRRPWLPIGLTNAPSLPLGFMGDFSRPVSDFCGATLENVFGVRPPTIRSGFGVNVNAALGRMNVVVTYSDPRVRPSDMERFLGAMASALLDE